MVSEIVSNSKTNSKNEEKSMRRFCEEVFPNLKENIETPGWLEGRTILTPTNIEVDTINEMMKDFLPNAASKLLSADTLENPQDAFRYNSEYLNTLKRVSSAYYQYQARNAYHAPSQYQPSTRPLQWDSTNI